MNRFKARTAIFIFMVIITCGGPLPAVEMNPGLEMEAGFRTVLSSQSSDTWLYYRPFLDIGCRTDYFGIYAGYAANVNFRIFDVESAYRDISLHTTSVNIELYPIGGLSAGFDFHYVIGEASYSGTEYTASIGYDFTKISILGEFSYSAWDYLLNGSSTDNMSYAVYGELAYNALENFSIDLSYTHMYYKSDELGIDIRKNVFRPGLMAGMKNVVYFLGGVGLGWAEETFVAGFDAGINIYPWKYLKISLLYIFSYNKDLDPDVINNTAFSSPDESYDEHRFLVGISFVVR
ncbi:MAG TPA: hypothetical protein PK573_06830 [Spirochaetota bacterium]|nr:hypothetical protein [Spirochaetota bacterium]HRZ26827.1 hypothetical protein [Spirochaetota bacterium]HSA14425.1 hypothetical protein [Spirochaetota bacterium]